MRRLLWAAAALGAGLALCGVNTAMADFAWDLTCSGITCTEGGSLGKLTITENPADTQIVYSVSLSKGAIWDSGITTFFAFVTGNIKTVAANGTTAGTWTAGNFFGDVWADCSRGRAANCGTTLTVTVDGTGLGIGFVELPNHKTHFDVYAGLDISCDHPHSSGCTDGSALRGRQTGFVGATADPVPGPILGGGLPGLIAACTGLLAFFARRRRQEFA